MPAWKRLIKRYVYLKLHLLAVSSCFFRFALNISRLFTYISIYSGYDCCSLTLQPCRTPMVSPEGWLFDKEALLKYIIEKKQEYARKLKEYERQKDRDLKVRQIVVFNKIGNRFYVIIKISEIN